MTLVEVLWIEEDESGRRLRKIKGEIVEETAEFIVIQTLTQKLKINKRYWVKTQQPLKEG